MGRMTTLDLPAQPVPDRGEDSDGARGGEAIVSLGSWMAILGSIRLVLAVAEYATAYREALGAGPSAHWRLVEFLRENPPVLVLIGAWPLALGLMLRRTRWPELVKAGAVTFLVLSIGGVLTATSDWGRSPNRWVAIGSFRVSAGGALAAGAGRGGAGAGGRVPVAAGARNGLARRRAGLPRQGRHRHDARARGRGPSVAAGPCWPCASRSSSWS